MLKKRLVWLGILALGLIPFVGGYAHVPAQTITVPVAGGWDARAACEESANEGTWTFTITELSGKISQVDVQVYANAYPTYVDGDPRVCASFPDPYGREQQTCQAVSGTVETAGSVSITKPKVGKSASLSLEAGIYCVRAVVRGKGSVTVSISHP